MENYDDLFQIDVPYVAYADFEALQDPVTGDEGKNTRRVGAHEPVAVAVKIVSTDPAYYKKPALFEGAGCTEELLTYLATEAENIAESLYKKIDMKMTSEDKRAFGKADKCWICGGGKEKGERFVRDHDHVTGEYRGAAHNTCNLQCNLNPASFKLPVLFHNLSGYDAHLIVERVSQSKFGRMSCIPKTSERFISFEVGKLVFKDSANFTQAPLGTLVKNLKERPEQMRETRRFIEDALMNPSTAVEIRKTVAPATPPELTPELDEECNDDDGDEEGHSDDEEARIAELEEIMGVRQDSDDEQTEEVIPARKRRLIGGECGTNAKRGRCSTLIEDEADASDDDEEMEVDLVETEYDREFVNDDDDQDDDDGVHFHRQLDAERVGEELEEAQRMAARFANRAHEATVEPQQPEQPPAQPTSSLEKYIGSVAMTVREQVRSPPYITSNANTDSDVSIY